MAWKTPKTDWNQSSIPTADDFNDIGNCLEELGKMKINNTPFSEHVTTLVTYAPVNGGSRGQVLKSNDNEAPTWINQTDLSVGNATTTEKVQFASSTNKTYLCGVTSTTNGQKLSYNSAVYATNGSLYATKLNGDGSALTDVAATKVIINGTSRSIAFSNGILSFN